ncbi:MAG: TIGR03435 family protein [Acidobacteriota bacterium]|nr:TIGR03435 family protein [Acidobacteriota bacterium]
MKKLMMLVAAIVLMFGTTAARAQDITGDWQGTLKVGKGLRIIMHLYKGDKDGLSVTMYSIDQTPQPIAGTSVTRDGASVKIAIDMIPGKYDGKLSADGKMMSGTWTQGTQPFPLDLVKATPETAWGIPEAPKPEKPMAEDADPSFDVATIKPNITGGPNLQQLTMVKRDFVVKNGSLQDLIAFAYDVQVKQIEGGPDWISKDRYDVAAIPDAPGQPSMMQMRGMVKKMLTERFAMKLHSDKREMPAYVLTAGKGGQKLTASQIQGILPGLSMSPGKGGFTLNVMNATMKDLTGFMQMLVLDRPVVNQTDISGRYDMHVTFTPDLSMFNGRGLKATVEDGVEPAPDLYDAMEQQLGLKLTQQKAPVDVVVIEHLEKPSAN